MILPSDQSVLTGTAKSHNFGIEMNESMFQMLTKNVYTDTILAVMREWSTNAIDACIAAGNPINYDVNLPTILNQQFSVRDYGTGLTPDEVNGLFSMLGASTKRNSNDYNGTFGIGRLSGLAYADSFTVESFIDGTCYTFAVSTDSGIPQLVSLGSISTHEPNGLRMSIEVSPNDISKFKSRAEDLYKFFDVKPNINIDITIPKPTKLVEGDNWYLEDTKYEDPYHEVPLIVMGNVAYNIPINKLSTGEFSAFSYTSLRIEAPLGAVSITPGRESLNMDNSTISYITKQLYLIRSELSDKFLDGAANQPEGFPRMIYMNKIIKSLPYKLRVLVEPKLTLTESVYFNIDTRYSSKEVRLTKPSYPGLKFQVYESHRVTGGNWENCYKRSSSPEVSNNIHYLLADIRTGIKNAVQAYRDKLKDEWLEANPGKYYSNTPLVIVVKPDKWDRTKVAESLALMKEYISKLGNPQAVTASSVYTETTHTSTSNNKSTTAFYPILFTNYYGTAIRISKGHVQITPNDTNTYYYVGTSGYNLDTISSELLSIYVRFANIYKNQVGETLRIIGVPKSHINKVKKDSRFIPLIGAFDQFSSKVKLIDTYDTKNLYWNTNTSHYSMTTFVLEYKDKLPSDILEYLTAINEFEDKYPHSKQSVVVDGIIDTLNTATIRPDTQLTYDIIVQRYPMLLAVFRNLNDGNILRYLQLEYTVSQHNLTLQGE